MQAVKNATILLLLSVTAALAYIDSRDPQPEWWQSVQNWLEYNFAKLESNTPAKVSSPPTKSVEKTEQLDTPVGSLVVVKYTGDECLYAKATVAHANYHGGLENLKKQLQRPV